MRSGIGLRASSLPPGIWVLILNTPHAERSSRMGCTPIGAVFEHGETLLVTRKLQEYCGRLSNGYRGGGMGTEEEGEGFPRLASSMSSHPASSISSIQIDPTTRECRHNVSHSCLQACDQNHRIKSIHRVNTTRTLYANWSGQQLMRVVLKLI